MGLSAQKDANENIENWYYFPEFFSTEEVNEIHKLAEGVKFQEAKLNSGSNDLHGYRKSEIKWLTPNIEGIEWVYQKLTKFCIEMNSALWQFDINEQLGSLQYGVYRSDGGHYDWHMDLGQGLTRQRKISMVIQLSSIDEYEGGEFEMFVNKEVLEFPKEKGAVILFPSYCMHRVTPITKGERKSLVLWVSGLPFK